MNNYETSKRGVIQRWRKKKGLCLNCGLDIHKEKCNESLEKADMRVFESEKSNPTNFDRKKKTILSYRIKKILCLRCGKTEHNDYCKETYDKSDNRSEGEKSLNPKIISTPKDKGKPIIEVLKEKSKVENELKIKEHQDFKPKYSRKYILLDSSENINGERIDFTAIRYIASKVSSYILCVVADFENYFSMNELIQIKKITNISEVKNKIERNIINHIKYCDLFLSYKSKYTEYSELKKIPTIVFENKNIGSRHVKLPRKFLI